MAATGTDAVTVVDEAAAVVVAIAAVGAVVVVEVVVVVGGVVVDVAVDDSEVTVGTARRCVEEQLATRTSIVNASIRRTAVG